MASQSSTTTRAACARRRKSTAARMRRKAREDVALQTMMEGKITLTSQQITQLTMLLVRRRRRWQRQILRVTRRSRYWEEDLKGLTRCSSRGRCDPTSLKNGFLSWMKSSRDFQIIRAIHHHLHQHSRLKRALLRSQAIILHLPATMVEFPSRRDSVSD